MGLTEMRLFEVISMSETTPRNSGKCGSNLPFNGPLPQGMVNFEVI
jgi:hypothetical protein